MSIFIQLPSIDELRKRLENRKTDTPEEIEKRITKANFEIQFSYMFDTIVVNDDLQQACHQVET